MDLALNNLQRLGCHKTKQTKQTKHLATVATSLLIGDLETLIQKRFFQINVCTQGQAIYKINLVVCVHACVGVCWHLYKIVTRIIFSSPPLPFIQIDWFFTLLMYPDSYHPSLPTNSTILSNCQTCECGKCVAFWFCLNILYLRSE